MVFSKNIFLLFYIVFTCFFKLFYKIIIQIRKMIKNKTLDIKIIFKIY